MFVFGDRSVLNSDLNMIKLTIGVLSLIALTLCEDDSNRHRRQSFDQLNLGLNGRPLANRLANPLEGTYTIWGGNPNSQLQRSYNPFQSVINPYQDVGLDLSSLQRDAFNPYQGLTERQLTPNIDWNSIPKQRQFQLQRTQQLNLQQLLAQQELLNQRNLQQPQINPWLLRQQQPSSFLWQTPQVNPFTSGQQIPNPWVLRTQQQRPLLLQQKQPLIQLQQPQVNSLLLRKSQPQIQHQQINPTIYRQPLLHRQQQPIIQSQYLPQANLRPLTLQQQHLPPLRIPQPSPISPHPYHVQPNNHFRIIEQQSILQPNNYQYGFSTENHIQAAEDGAVEPNDNNDSVGSRVRGFYEYLGNDGQTYHVDYTADENGFRPTGKHIASVTSAPAESVPYHSRGSHPQGLQYAVPSQSPLPQFPTTIPYGVSSPLPQLSVSPFVHIPGSQIQPTGFSPFPTLQPSPSPLIFNEVSSSISPFLSYTGQPTPSPSPAIFQSTLGPLQQKK